MNRRLRLVLFAVSIPAFAAVYGAGVFGLPPFGHYRGPYGDILNGVTVQERHITDVVTAVNFDYRGFDTLGEEYIMFMSVMGVQLLLRKKRSERKAAPRDEAEARSAPPPSDAVEVLGLGFIGPLLVFGAYVVTHGQLTPGGGFQGGVLLASALWLVYLAGQYEVAERVAPRWLIEWSESGGAAGYALIGCLALATGAEFLKDVLPSAPVGSILSGGTVALIDLAVGFEVAGGLVLLLQSFFEETLMLREES
jgi:multicomponent Na+:H+ antiporter subunit B